ncbi:carboxypeptidase-like regulatory domain-containing protein [Maribacter sp. 2304DJ31-5]|uniref:carboxypeptidase-like regulatory domain-containing protein n=1 Tax=Maribacter sp. 2304DJ31-5 TaxID=3386273 RepID=UPI0039BC61DE
MIIFGFKWSFAQMWGTIIDEENGKSIPYVNVWVKNTMVGATTGENGKFFIEKVKIGDTIRISSLGYLTIEFLAQKKENMITLKPKINELDEVIIIPKKNSFKFTIESYNKIKKNRPWYNNGHYSLARYYEFKPEYEKTPFIDKVSLIANNAKKENVIFRIRLVEANTNREPSEKGLFDNIVLECKNGVKEIFLDLNKEKIVFPESGFFVVIDRLDLKENESFNKVAKMNILQPAIGMERIDQEKNTWLGFGGKWLPPSEMKQILGTNRNIAVNIDLTN